MSSKERNSNIIKIKNKMDKREIIFERINKNIQLSPEQLISIIDTLKPPCNLLVFGVGNDSSLWIKANKDGNTVFIENNIDWLNKVKRINPELKSVLVEYKTVLSKWKDIIDKPKELEMDFNSDDYDIRKTKWDVIIVDAPMGYEEAHPGRMQSIYEASRIIKDGGHVFVHDCNRKVEGVYTTKFLLTENLIEEIGNLRHYKINKQI
jgi:uncharacterized protein (TIGR01627 family)